MHFAGRIPLCIAFCPERGLASSAESSAPSLARPSQSTFRMELVAILMWVVLIAAYAWSARSLRRQGSFTLAEPPARSSRGTGRIDTGGGRLADGPEPLASSVATRQG